MPSFLLQHSLSLSVKTTSSPTCIQHRSSNVINTSWFMILYFTPTESAAVTGEPGSFQFFGPQRGLEGGWRFKVSLRGWLNKEYVCILYVCCIRMYSLHFFALSAEHSIPPIKETKQAAWIAQPCHRWVRQEGPMAKSKSQCFRTWLPGYEVELHSSMTTKT